MIHTKSIIQEVLHMDRTEALALLQQYNKEPFHIQHALTVEAVMGYFAEKRGRKSVLGDCGSAARLGF